MPEETNGNATPKIAQPTNPKRFDIPRNDVEIQLEEYRTTKGKNPGKTAFKPVVGEKQEDKQKFLTWVGFDNLFNMAMAKVKGLTLGWAEEAVDEDNGEFTDNVFIKLASDFSTRGETIGELEEQFDDVRTDFMKLDLMDQSDENRARIVELGKKMQDLTISIQSKKKPRKATSETAPVPA